MAIGSFALGFRACLAWRDLQDKKLSDRLRASNDALSKAVEDNKTTEE